MIGSQLIGVEVGRVAPFRPEEWPRFVRFPAFVGRSISRARRPGDGPGARSGRWQSPLTRNRSQPAIIDDGPDGHRPQYLVGGCRRRERRSWPTAATGSSARTSAASWTARSPTTGPLAPSPSAARPRPGRRRAVADLQAPAGSNTMAIKAARGRGSEGMEQPHGDDRTDSTEALTPAPLRDAATPPDHR